MPSKPEFPPLLPPGLHPMTLADIHGRCVTAFEMSKSRGPIMAGLEAVVGRMERAGLPLDLWVDGSFMTQKIDPDDVDLVAVISQPVLEGFTPEQHDVMLWFEEDEVGLAHRCHGHIVVTYPRSHPLYPIGEKLRKYWLDAFGRAWVNKEPKGIATLRVGGSGAQ